MKNSLFMKNPNMASTLFHGESERRHFATPSQGAWGNTLIKADAV
jgi:hypothetical protein